MKEQEESRRGVVRTRLCEGQETACRRDRFRWWSDNPCCTAVETHKGTKTLERENHDASEYG